jgi:hypothetical protein
MVRPTNSQAVHVFIISKLSHDFIPISFAAASPGQRVRADAPNTLLVSFNLESPYKLLQLHTNSTYLRQQALQSQKRASCCLALPLSRTLDDP